MRLSWSKRWEDEMVSRVESKVERCELQKTSQWGAAAAAAAKKAKAPRMRRKFL